MTPPTTYGKHVEDAISGNCLDRISSLPDELLGLIISFLPTTSCAVKASILSKRWRYLFTLTTCLSFDDKRYPMENERIEFVRRFKEYVDNVLKLHKITPIKKFSLVCHATYNNSDLNRWFTYALQKGVHELHYKLGNQTDCVPNYDGSNIEIPLSTPLPKLKILHLDHIMFFDFESIQRLFSGCELLEELTLEYCKCDTDGHATHCTGILKVLTIEDCRFWYGTFEIDAPNLAYLNYSSNFGVRIVPSWKNSCSFKEAKLTFNWMKAEVDDSDTNVDLLECDRELLIAAASKVVELRLEMESVQILLAPHEDDEQMPDFPSLSTLYIEHFPYYAWEYVTRLLEKSPKLELLIFESGLHCCQCSDFNCPDPCYDSLPSSDIHLLPFSCHVRKIHVLKFCGHEGPLSLMGHLLRNASDLGDVCVYTFCGDGDGDDDSDSDDDYEMKTELEIYRDLLRLPRASKDCCIEMMK